MHLPELGLQFIYGRLAWGILLAAIIVALWPRRLVLSRAVIAAVVLAATALQALPGEASPAYWLGLAWQAPSALLVALSLVSLYRGSGSGSDSAQNSAVMSPALALWLAAAGTILYVDAMGLTAIGWYYWGFGPYAAPVMALLLAGASVLALVRGQARPQACALLLALMGFALLRLPTGNLWDALLDPLLWGWALLSVARLGWTRKQQAMPTRPARLNG